MDAAMLWVPLTLIAAATQVVRNSAQANLTGKIGTLGATQVRFVFGLPFAVLRNLCAGRKLGVVRRQPRALPPRAVCGA